jgi:glycine cleavage system regulatory protein
VDREDVAAYAYDLVRHDCDDGPEVAEIVHKLAHFFSHASMRMAQLSTRVQLEHGRRYSA